MEKFAVVDTDKCKPEKCKSCVAVEACTHNLLEQEAADEPPMLLSTRACVGCGDCAKVCPLHAIFIQHGSEASRMPAVETP